MCFTANSTRECAGSICQVVGVSTWGAILAVIGVPPCRVRRSGRQKRALVLPGAGAPADGHEPDPGCSVRPPSTRRATTSRARPCAPAGVARRCRTRMLSRERSLRAGADIHIVPHVLYFVKRYPQYNDIDLTARLCYNP